MYPPFASRILFELHRKGTDYWVNMTVNNVPVILKGACNGTEMCSLQPFLNLLGEISYVDRKDEYQAYCGSDFKPNWNAFIQTEALSITEKLQLNFAMMVLVYGGLFTLVTAVVVRKKDKREKNKTRADPDAVLI